MSKFNEIITALILVVAVFALNACHTHEIIDPDIEIPGLGGYEYERTELDNWLDQTFLYPYNIKVHYRWDAAMSYTSLNKKLTPIKIEKVRPMMEALSKVWFEPFLYAAPHGFLQKYTPKTVILVGSPEYQANGSAVLLGSAEGATTIFLTNANAFEPADVTAFTDYLHVIEHEYVHILTQSVVMPPAFKAVSRQYYDPMGWQNLENNDAAIKLGFFSRYSLSAPEEDFAEIVSLLMVNGIEDFERRIIPIAESSTVNPYAAQNLREKVRIAREYYKENFSIDFYDDPRTGKTGLINLVRQAVDNLVNSSGR